ncbi:hypothetical protein INR49_009610, partial [Caranx melampygus]
MDGSDVGVEKSGGVASASIPDLSPPSATQWFVRYLLQLTGLDHQLGKVYRYQLPRDSRVLVTPEADPPPTPLHSLHPSSAGVLQTDAGPGSAVATRPPINASFKGQDVVQVLQPAPLLSSPLADLLLFCATIVWIRQKPGSHSCLACCDAALVGQTPQAQLTAVSAMPGITEMAIPGDPVIQGHSSVHICCAGQPGWQAVLGTSGQGTWLWKGWDVEGGWQLDGDGDEMPLSTAQASMEILAAAGGALHSPVVLACWEFTVDGSNERDQEEAGREKRVAWQTDEKTVEAIPAGRSYSGVTMCLQDGPGRRVQCPVEQQVSCRGDRGGSSEKEGEDSEQPPDEEQSPDCNRLSLYKAGFARVYCSCPRGDHTKWFLLTHFPSCLLAGYDCGFSKQSSHPEKSWQPRREEQTTVKLFVGPVGSALQHWPKVSRDLQVTDEGRRK